MDEFLGHLQYAQRWIDQYNCYVNDTEWGRMFVRLCPIFRSRPGSASTNITGSPHGCGRRGFAFGRRSRPPESGHSQLLPR